MDMKPFEETPMADDVPLVKHTPRGRFDNVAKAFRDLDLYGDLTKPTVVYRDGREDPPTYGWCYQELWDHTHYAMGSRGCSAIMFRAGRRKSGKSAYV
jgi:hypothetical protein